MDALGIEFGEYARVTEGEGSFGLASSKENDRDQMVPKMKEAGIISTAVFMLDLGSELEDSSIFFGGRDSDKIASESDIHWSEFGTGE